MSESVESSQPQHSSPPNRHFKTVRSKIPSWLANAAPHVHRALRKAGANRLPWYEQARQSMPDVTEALRQDYLLHLACEKELSEALTEFPSLEAFAEPLLVTGIKERFGLDVDVRKTWLFHARRMQVDDSFVNASRDPLVQYQQSLKVSTQTLLHAALQNYEAWEAEPAGMDLDKRQKAAIYDRYPVSGLALVGTVLAMPPHTFAALCRELDLGGQYQKKLDAFLNPPSSPKPAPGAATDNRRGLFKRVEQSAFRIEVHLAYLRKS